ncbi:hypothetical protein ACUY2G_10445 [Corynebacterium guaraldiae]|uniref:hypothetical protein n=1 Tax=uncultured Corynebacterium sp. TaxID=159447 RepID=UPI0021B41ED7|nr:hypothetical protein [uncultured Corynebacterium sp.]
MTTTALLDIGIPKKNVEGYPDPTCYRALKAIQRAEIDWAHQMDIPNHHQITDQAGLEQVARLDHVAAAYTNDRRSSASFISSDCVVMDIDIDNDHTEESSNWVTPEKLAELMAGVVFMTATSRNHQKAKGVLAVRFGFFDQQALDAGRFIYGTTNGPSAGWRS